ncbi:MAG: cation-translocating P-type ATPase [Candidatus Saccharimonadales bacterium]
MLYYTQSTQKTLQSLKTAPSGLTPSDAKERLSTYGRNEVKVSKTPLWKIIVEPFANIFMAVLGVATVLSVWHGEWLDASIIGFIMLVNALIFYIQTYSTQKVLRTLAKKTQQKALVIRGGKETEVDVTLLVPGDIVLLGEGEKIPADGRVINSNQLRVNESQLTGESEPISKNTTVVHSEAPLYERTNMVYQGSFVIGGNASFAVTATGSKTEFGAIASLVKKDELVSPIQRKIDKLISQIIMVILALAVVAFGLSIANGMEWLEAVRFVLALAVSAVPESLPIAISVVLVLGMRRMAAKKALVQTMRSIETIGAVTTIASDKTGTLTQNKLSLATTWQPQDTTVDLAQHAMKTISLSGHSLSDPLDIAIDDFAKSEGIQRKQAPLTSFAFDQDLAMSGSLWHDGKRYGLYIKGAPEHILRRSKVSSTIQREVLAALKELTSKGYRVIAIAHATIDKPIDSLDHIPPKTALTFDGLLAVADQLRPEAKKAIQAAQKAGVSVRMITGDHLETAYFIGKTLGMASTRDQIFDARTMDSMTDDELAKTLKDVRVFARVIPEQKYRLLTILKRNNITAMTGDGVNDVPALSSAHVGLAMGSGSHIAKDAGDIILLDDNFKTIIDALREGRTIISNVRRMLYYLLSTNAGEIMTMMFSLFVGLPIPLVPVQILWVNLVTDTFMVIPLGLEPASKTVLEQKPTSPKAPILPRHMIVRMLLIALSMAALTIGGFVYFLHTHGLEYARTVAFHILVLTQIANAFCARSDLESLLVRIRTWSTPFYLGLSATIATHALSLFTPLGEFLHMTKLETKDYLVTGLLALIIPIILSEVLKLIDRRRLQQK